VNTSTPFFLNTNEIISTNAELFDLVSNPDLEELLRELDYDWMTGELNERALLVPTLASHNLLEKDTRWKLNRNGLLFLSRLLLHFSSRNAEVFGNLKEKYKDFEVISSGKNSIVARARHQLLETNFILKLVRPGASTDIAKSVRSLSSLKPGGAIVLPIYFLKVDTVDFLGKRVTLDCLVFPYVKGVTFRKFLAQENHHLNSQVVISFARQVGNALAELEKIGAYHGDLHEDNILVDQYSTGGIRFRIVDISFDAMGSLPFEVCRNSDLANFKQHIWRILSVQKAFMPRMSLRKYIGTRNYLRIMNVLGDKTKSFADVCDALASDKEYNEYVLEKANFISARFHRPVSFRLQRYEEITDPTIAVRLFVPFAQLMEKITTFSNMYVSGNRGSGKSTYLASLAFFPQAQDAIVDFRDIFGIYFPCRQGEFRPLASRPEWSAEFDRRLITGVLVVKIIRRTLETISAGIAAKKLTYPSSLHRLREFITSFVPPPGIVSVDPDIQTELENFVSTMVRVEVEEVGRLPIIRKLTGKEADSRSLFEFFGIVRETFGELVGSRFHLLLDDAGSPYVPSNVQRVINDLILTSNSLFCVKLSAEKLTFEFENFDGKVLENGQDYFEYDISQILFIGTGSGGINRTVLESYFRQIVEKRLAYFSYQSTNITDYLGDELIPIDRLLLLLAESRKDAYYCGWTTVWNIADRTPRNLLEIVSEILAVGKLHADSKPRVVSMRDQDMAIRTISEKRLESLSQIPGSMTIKKATVSLGRHLFETTTAIGSTFRLYLKTEQIRRGRKRQHLAIERNDLRDMSQDAELVLKRLVTFGVLDSSRSAYARNDEVKKPFYVLNRIYCPAFGIGFRRDEHLRLSNGRLEQLLLDPQQFMRDGTRRIRNDSEFGHEDLFRYGDRYGRK
jgi:serine/threonine protein kinase